MRMVRPGRTTSTAALVQLFPCREPVLDAATAAHPPGSIRVAEAVFAIISFVQIVPAELAVIVRVARPADRLPFLETPPASL